MAKIKSVKSNTEVYAEIIADIASRAAAEIEGAELLGKNPDKSRIINGHTPVRTTCGESPMRAGGKRLVIDGGFSKPYHKTTGIAGYTLIYNSHGLQLVQHEAFENKEKAIEAGSDIHSRVQLEQFKHHRMLVRDTDRGHELEEQIQNLQKLLMAYRHGVIKEKV